MQQTLGYIWSKRFSIYRSREQKHSGVSCRTILVVDSRLAMPDDLDPAVRTKAFEFFSHPGTNKQARYRRRK